jgi:hypothetical protein
VQYLDLGLADGVGEAPFVGRKLRISLGDFKCYRNFTMLQLGVHLGDSTFGISARAV